MSNQEHEDFSNGIGDEVENFLRSVHGSEEEKPAEQPDRKIKSKIDADDADIEYSEAYEEVKAALEKVFEMCDKHGFSIQVAISDEPFSTTGEQGHRITICGHMTPNNVPCEMVAAAAVYQAHHLFSHMVLAMASAGSPLINPLDSDEEDHG